MALNGFNNGFGGFNNQGFNDYNYSDEDKETINNMMTAFQNFTNEASRGSGKEEEAFNNFTNQLVGISRNRLNSSNSDTSSLFSNNNNNSKNNNNNNNTLLTISITTVVVLAIIGTIFFIVKRKKNKDKPFKDFNNAIPNQVIYTFSNESNNSTNVPNTINNNSPLNPQPQTNQLQNSSSLQDDTQMDILPPEYTEQNEYSFLSSEPITIISSTQASQSAPMTTISSTQDSQSAPMTTISSTQDSSQSATVPPIQTSSIKSSIPPPPHLVVPAQSSPTVQSLQPLQPLQPLQAVPLQPGNQTIPPTAQPIIIVNPNNMNYSIPYIPGTPAAIAESYTNLSLNNTNVFFLFIIISIIDAVSILLPDKSNIFNSGIFSKLISNL